MITIKRSKELCRKWGFASLVTLPTANAKLAKSTGYYNAGITLAQGDKSGHEVCPGRGNCVTFEGCDTCLGNFGQAEGLSSIDKVRIARTKMMFEDRANFDLVLECQLEQVDRKARRLGLPVAFRPNILSEHPWHLTHPWIFERYSNWTFYGYTKVRAHFRQFLAGKLPANYHLTYSYNERVGQDFYREVLGLGGNVATVFLVGSIDHLPQTFMGADVIDGVSSDLRFLDKPGTVVGLIPKTPKRNADKLAYLDRMKRAGFMVSLAS